MASGTPRAIKRAMRSTSTPVRPSKRAALSCLSTLSTAFTEQLALLEEEKSVTRAGWSLAAALRHLATANEGVLVPLMNKHGIPKFYLSKEVCSDTYTALCRTIVGQQLAGAAVRKIWGRFVQQFEEGLSPSAFLSRSSTSADMEAIRSAVGLSNAKARALRSLSEFFDAGRLSDEALLSDELDNQQITELLVAVKGIGKWSAEMFLMFHLHKADLLPLGDLGVRNGISKHFGVGAKKGGLHEKKDGAMMKQLFEEFKPYRSVAAWYMWRALESGPYDEAME